MIGSENEGVLAKMLSSMVSYYRRDIVLLPNPTSLPGVCAVQADCVSYVWHDHPFEEINWPEIRLELDEVGFHLDIHLLFERESDDADHERIQDTFELFRQLGVLMHSQGHRDVMELQLTCHDCKDLGKLDNWLLSVSLSNRK